jgi:hypothetical protein
MKKFLMLLVASTLVLSITGCKKEDPVEDATKKIGEKVEEGAKKVEDAKK